MAHLIREALGCRGDVFPPVAAPRTPKSSSVLFWLSVVADRGRWRPRSRSPGLRAVLVVAAAAVAGRIAVCAAATTVEAPDGAPPQRPPAQAVAGWRGPAPPTAARLCLGGPGGELIDSPAGEHCLRAARAP